MYPRRIQKRSKFTQDEDARLISLVEKHGASAWHAISEKMPGRNPRQCKERWFSYLCPGIRTDPFTPEEDLLILSKYKEIGPKWVRMTQFFSGRTDTNLKNRYILLQRRIRRGIPLHDAQPQTPPAVEVNYELPSELVGFEEDVWDEMFGSLASFEFF